MDFNCVEGLPASALAFPCQEQRKFPTKTACLVHVQWIENDGSFWVLLNQEVPTIEFVSQHLMDCEHDRLSAIVAEDFVSAFDANDQSWYRAKILMTEPLTIQFIDFGNVSESSPEFLASLPPHMKSIHQLAIHVKLASESNIIPRMGDQLLINYVTSENGIAVVSPAPTPVETVPGNGCVQSPELVTFQPSYNSSTDTTTNENLKMGFARENSTMTEQYCGEQTITGELETEEISAVTTQSGAETIQFVSRPSTDETISVVSSGESTMDNIFNRVEYDSSETIAGAPRVVASDTGSAKPSESVDSKSPMDDVVILQEEFRTELKPEELELVASTLPELSSVPREVGGETVTDLPMKSTMDHFFNTVEYDSSETIAVAPRAVASDTGSAKPSESVDSNSAVDDMVILPDESSTELKHEELELVASTLPELSSVPREVGGETVTDLPMKSTMDHFNTVEYDSSETIAVASRVVASDTGSAEPSESVDSKSPMDDMVILPDESSTELKPEELELVASTLPELSSVPREVGGETVTDLPMKSTMDHFFNTVEYDSSETIAVAPRAVASDTGSAKPSESVDSNSPVDDMILPDESSTELKPEELELVASTLPELSSVPREVGGETVTDLPMKSTMDHFNTVEYDSSETIAVAPRAVASDTGSAKPSESVDSNSPVDDVVILDEFSTELKPQEMETVASTLPTFINDQEISAVPREVVVETVLDLPRESTTDISNVRDYGSLELVSAVTPVGTSELVFATSKEDVAELVPHVSERGTSEAFANLPKVVASESGSDIPDRTILTIADASIGLDVSSSMPTASLTDKGLNASAKVFTMSEIPPIKGKNSRDLPPPTENLKRKKESKDKSEFTHQFELRIIQEQIRIQMLKLQQRMEQELDSVKCEMSRQLANVYADMALLRNDIQMGRHTKSGPPMNLAQYQNLNPSGNMQPFQHETASACENTHQYYGYENRINHLGYGNSSSYNSPNLPSEQQSSNNRETTLNQSKVQDCSASEKMEMTTVKSCATKLIWVNRISKDVTMDHLSILFGVYGNVQRIKKLCDSSAIIEMADHDQAAQAVRFLNFGPLKGSKLSVALSKYVTLYITKEDYTSNLAKDFTKSQYPMPNWHRFQAGKWEWDAKKLVAPCNKLKMLCISKYVSDDQMKEKFVKKGYHVSLHSVPGRFGDKRTIYFTFSSTEEAINALCDFQNTEYADWAFMNLSFVGKQKF